jgi:S1-C subfamily serine protease
MLRLPALLSSIAFVFLICRFDALAAGPFGTINLGYWKGGAYTNEAGAFTHCAAGADFANGVGVLIGQMHNRSWMLGFTDKSWSLVQGTSIPIDLTFDGQSQFHVFGVALSPVLISAPLPDPVLQRLRKSRFMVTSGNARTAQFSLTDADKMIAMISNCVEKVKAGGIANAGDFSVVSPKPTVSPAAAKPSGDAASSPAKPSKLTHVSGTGFVVSSGGHILTNNHVIADCVSDPKGNLTGQPASNLRVVSRDETNDLALVQTAGTFKNIAHLRSSAVHSGDSVIAIGYPYHGLLTSDFTVTTGIVSSLSGILNDTRFLQISAPVQPGNSGGPLLDTSGNVVGVVSEKLNAVKFAKVTGDIPENVNFAIKTGAVRDFLDNSVIPYQTSDAGLEQKTTQIASDARAYTMLITCTAKIEEQTK